MTCDCKEKPCGCNNCPDDEEITQLTPLDSDECSTCGGCNSCSPCSTKQCSCNIVSDSECLTVDTSECGTVHLSVECPPVVEAGENIRVDVEECSEGEGCSKKYIVNSKVKDEKVKVKACGDADYLVNLVKPGKGISITSDCNSLYINNDCCKDDPEEKILDVSYQGKLLNVSHYETEGAHVLNILDVDEPHCYAKWTLLNSATETRPANLYDEYSTILEDITTWQNATWYPQPKGKQKVGMPSFNSNCDCDVEGEIKILKQGLYQVGFSGSAEVNYGVHAFRIQMYRVPDGVEKKKGKTILESRYSGPLGYSLASSKFQSVGSLKYVKEVDFDKEDAPTGIYNDAFPLIGEVTETEGQAQLRGGSQSLGAVVDRVPIEGNTIVELGVGDIIYVGGKLSTSVSGDGGEGSLYNNSIVPSMRGHISVLGLNDKDGDNGGECGFSFYVNMIHPLPTTAERNILN